MKTYFAALAIAGCDQCFNHFIADYKGPSAAKATLQLSRVDIFTEIVDDVCQIRRCVDIEMMELPEDSLIRFHFRVTGKNSTTVLESSSLRNISVRHLDVGIGGVETIVEFEADSGCTPRIRFLVQSDSLIKGSTEDVRADFAIANTSVESLHVEVLPPGNGRIGFVFPDYRSERRTDSLVQSRQAIRPFELVSYCFSLN